MLKYFAINYISLVEFKNIVKMQEFGYQKYDGGNKYLSVLYVKNASIGIHSFYKDYLYNIFIDLKNMCYLILRQYVYHEFKKDYDLVRN